MKKSLALLIGPFLLLPITKANLQTDLVNVETLSPTSFYYQRNKEPVVVTSDWYQKNEDWKLIHTFNLGAINPTRYRLLHFLGKEEDFYTKVSWGNEKYLGLTLRNFSFILNIPQTKITNRKITNPYDVPRCVSKGRFFVLQNFATTWLLATFSVKQYFVMTWFYENGNHYLQVFWHYHVRVTGSYVGGAVWLKIGTGIDFLVTDNP